MRGILSFAHPNQPEGEMVLPHFEIEEIKKQGDLAEVGYASAGKPATKQMME